jgi:hypothetical protein
MLVTHFRKRAQMVAAPPKRTEGRRTYRLTKASRPLAVEQLEDRTLLSNSAPTTAAFQAAYGQLPLAFETNQGQAAAQINFVARGAGYALSLMPTEAVLGLHKPASTPAPETPASPGERHSVSLPVDVVQLQLVGANPAAPALGLDELITRSNYFLGNDPSRWRTNIPNYGRVEYQNVYPGINLVYYGNQDQLEYDFVVAPGTDPSTISFAVGGTQSITLDSQANLVLHAVSGDLVEQAPVLYQEFLGVRQAVSGRFVLEGHNQVGFQVGAYDPSRPLVIDPVLSYSTYLGGSSEDFGNAIAVDGSGNAYVTGQTSSTNFPTTAGAFQTTLQNLAVAFVTKLNATGTALVYSTYLGGNGISTYGDGGYGIAVDSAGNAYVAGTTDSSNFPTTAGAFQTALKGNRDAFITKLAPSGNSLIYSTYLGGSGTDTSGILNGSAPPPAGHPIAVDSAGNTYLVGSTTSTDFPTTAGSYQPTWPGGSPGYITEVNTTGTGLVYSTYIPGGPGSSIALSAGQVYVAGFTSSTSFPTTSNALQKSLSGSMNAFLAVLNLSVASPAAQLVYSTYLGGNGGAQAYGMAVDSSGNAYLTGYAGSNFPTTAGAFQTKNAGNAVNAFVAKFNLNPAIPSGYGSLLYSTYLGGNGGADGYAIAVDDSGNAYVTGQAFKGFPTVNPIQSSLGMANRAAFVTILNASGSGLLFSTYLGGTNGYNYTIGRGIALDGSGNTYLTGVTGENGSNIHPVNFPTTTGAFETTFGGGNYDAFVAKISPAVSIAAAPSTSPGKESPVEFAVNALSLAGIAVSIDLSPAAAGGRAPQGTMLAPIVVFSQPLVPLKPGAAAGPTALPRPLRQEFWIERVFAEFDDPLLEHWLLGEMPLA